MQPDKNQESQPDYGQINSAQEMPNSTEAQSQPESSVPSYAPGSTSQSSYVTTQQNTQNNGPTDTAQINENTQKLNEITTAENDEENIEQKIKDISDIPLPPDEINNRKALIIGINYTNLAKGAQLSGCLNDAYRVKEFL